MRSIKCALIKSVSITFARASYLATSQLTPFIVSFLGYTWDAKSARHPMYKSYSYLDNPFIGAYSFNLIQIGVQR